MHLFNYLPPHSSHAPGVLKSLIYGLFRSYLHQNTYKRDFLENIQKLHNRLVKRGHPASTIRDMIITCAKFINTTPNKTNTNTDKDLTDNLFYHTPFHPRDISRQRIHDIFDQTCTKPDTNGDSLQHGIHNKHGGIVKFSKLIVAYSRPKNLRDILCSSSLTTTDPTTNLKTRDNIASCTYKRMTS